MTWEKIHFQQGNDLHTLKAAQNRFKVNKVSVLEWLRPKSNREFVAGHEKASSHQISVQPDRAKAVLQTRME